MTLPSYVQDFSRNDYELRLREHPQLIAILPAKRNIQSQTFKVELS